MVDEHGTGWDLVIDEPTLGFDGFHREAPVLPWRTRSAGATVFNDSAEWDPLRASFTRFGHPGRWVYGHLPVHGLMVPNRSPVLLLSPVFALRAFGLDAPGNHAAEADGLRWENDVDSQASSVQWNASVQFADGGRAQIRYSFDAGEFFPRRVQVDVWTLPWPLASRDLRVTATEGGHAFSVPTRSPAENRSEVRPTERGMYRAASGSTVVGPTDDRTTWAPFPLSEAVESALRDARVIQSLRAMPDAFVLNAFRVETTEVLHRLQWGLLIGSGCAAAGSPRNSPIQVIVEKEVTANAVPPGTTFVNGPLEPCLGSENVTLQKLPSRWIGVDEAWTDAARRGWPGVETPPSVLGFTGASACDAASPWSVQAGRRSADGDIWISLVNGQVLMTTHANQDGGAGEPALFGQFTECPPTAPP